METALFSPQLLEISHLRWCILLALAPFLLLGLSPFLGLPVCLILSALAVAVNAVLSFYLRNRQNSGFPVVYGFASALSAAPRLAKALQSSGLPITQELRAVLQTLKGAKRAIFVLHLSEAIIASTGLIDPLSFFLLPALCYGRVVATLRRQPAEALQLVELVGELDLSISLLSLRQMLPYWCHPRWAETSSLTFCGLYHPLLRDAVPNDAHFTRDVLLTGSNASGKSTFLKSAALCCITAQALNTCFAHEFSLRRGAVLSSMALQDSIFEGDSYFVAELKSMKRMVDAAEAGPFCTIFIDEVLRGTNTTERIAASRALLRYLGCLPCLVLAATHDLELTGLLAAQFDNYHFRESIQNGCVVFDYRLHPGPSQTRNALLLMKQMQFPEQILAEARTVES